MSEQWPFKKLGDCLEIQNGYAFASKQFDADLGMQLIRIRDLKNGTTTQMKFQGEYDQKFVVNKGDLLIGMDGEFVCYEWKGEPSLLNQRVCRLQNFSSELLPRFVYYGINKYLKLIEDNTSYTTVKHLSGKKIKDIDFPIPPLKEQQRIVCILDEALENISNSTEQIIQKIQNVNALFPSILKSLIPQDVNDCEEVLLGNKEYIQIIDGDRGVNYPKKSEFMNEGHCLFLNTKNVLRNGFNFDTTMFIDEEKDGLLRKGKLQRNDVILTTRGTLGNTAVYHDEIPFNHIRINSGMLMFRPNVEKIYPKYLYHLFTSDIVRSQISSHSRGAAQPHLPVNVLSKFLIPIPKSIDLQKVIVQRLELLATKYDLLLQKLRQEMESFDELRQSILQEAFDGKLTGGITA